MLAVFGSKVVLEFSHGIFTWVNGEDFEPAKYEATISDNKVYFSVHAVGRQGGDFSADYVDWSGSFDGKTLNDVTAVWTRNGRGNWLYNFLLPDVVRFKFKQKGEFRHSDFGSD
ncbi:MAG: hypothetical protein HKM98_04865 [Gammaproteobacteria bacterium]|nr:hypothetical protein [Gammaproteobacteria bacterium]